MLRCNKTIRSRAVSYYEYQDAIFYLCVGGLIAYMMFIIYKLAKESEAGRFGTFVLFLGLGLGFLGFLAKPLIKLTLGL
ncbi:MAG: DUF2788 domain-containing protein [Gammaproteobacteria bacterium]|nr:DUF2788 domain-containing protein [Gammaproteobacteria bacterium]